MSWAQKLYETYENNIQVDSEKGSESEKLLPLWHTYQNAHIEVTIDVNGNFIRALALASEELTLIPVTEESAKRSGTAIYPHPLCDNLAYVAGDLEAYGGRVKHDSKTGKSTYDVYIERLGAWADWHGAHAKVKAIHAYLSKVCLIEDLCKAGALALNKNGELGNVNGKLVRFIVVGDAVESCTWKDESLIQNWLDFNDETVEHQVRLDFLTGRFTPVMESHPRGILPAKFLGAKIISANDDTNYTYRGRFRVSEQAANLGCESSQKIHSALRWLRTNQGVRISTDGSCYYVYWSPNPNVNTSPLGPAVIIGTSLDQGAMDSFKSLLINMKASLDVTDDIIVMGLNAATKGQLSISDYYEFNGQILIDRLLKWNDQCSWLRRHDKKDVVWSPSLFSIARVVYGIERKGKLEVSDQLLQNTVLRLQKSMLTSQRFPRDIIQTLLGKVSNLQRYKYESRGWILSTACAVIRKYNYDMGKEIVDMVLDERCTNRSYLFGRLLAVYDRIEGSVLYHAGIERDTAAMRLQSSYVQYPARVAAQLDYSVIPYLEKLSSKSRSYYRAKIAEIIGLFEDGDFNRHRSLDENYLLGYYLQRSALFGGNNAVDAVNDDNNASDDNADGKGENNNE